MHGFSDVRQWVMKLKSSLFAVHTPSGHPS